MSDAWRAQNGRESGWQVQASPLHAHSGRATRPLVLMLVAKHWGIAPLCPSHLTINLRSILIHQTTEILDRVEGYEIAVVGVFGSGVAGARLPARAQDVSAPAALVPTDPPPGTGPPTRKPPAAEQAKPPRPSELSPKQERKAKYLLAAANQAFFDFF